jgi:hypothetical protein
LAAWYLVGQTQNSPENLQSQSSSAVTSFSVAAGRVMLASCENTSNQPMTWSLSTVAPSANHGSGTLMGAAEWNSNITTTASYLVAAQAGHSEVGTIAATYK